MTNLVTGGASYIGPHTVLYLLERSEDVVVLDKQSNSSTESLYRVEKLAGKAALFFRKTCRMPNACVAFLAHMRSLLSSTSLVLKPSGSRRANHWSNASGTLVLLDAMRQVGVHDFIF